jgi:hypothetical protein
VAGGGEIEIVKVSDLIAGLGLRKEVVEADVLEAYRLHR